MENEEKIKAKAQEIIKSRKLDEVFLTADLQGFTNKQRAENHAVYQKDKKVYHFKKTDFIVAEKDEKKVEDDTPDAEREQLVERYEQLFEKKPAHNIGIEKLKEKIAEKEQALEEAKGVTVQDATKVSAEDKKKDLKED